MLICQDTSVLLSVMKQELFKSSTCKLAKCMGRYKGLMGGFLAAGIWCCIHVCTGYAQPWMTPVCVWPFHSVFHGWIPGCRNLVLHPCMRWICSAMDDTCVVGPLLDTVLHEYSLCS